MTYLWGGMLLIGIVYAALTGNLQEVTEVVVSSSREAVNLCITMAGITAMWTGILKIAEKVGLVDQLAVGLKPFLRFLFPGLEGEEKVCGYISANFLSNMLGLGWASTASGLMAFQELDRLNREKCDRLGESGWLAKDLASKEMCTFLIINVSSLQLIPMSLIAYRAQYGSVNPAAITGPSIVTTSCSTLAAVLFCFWMNRRSSAPVKK